MTLYDLSVIIFQDVGGENVHIFLDINSTLQSDGVVVVSTSEKCFAYSTIAAATVLFFSERGRE
ncbi:hypothetical protein HMPREF0868_0713 [Mageeibacillus indolicus UPII9-5]|uniref:Uncharacterized protein n=1 Tax=Mageeibacillus indolicus (strain UPII9-5) TaxID=699246 RepID=D3R1H6_MAGIU|nr:hypothetical protein HMPREF0868_0713 [Mageeibacillus indolicus UPII9-5]